MSERVTEIDALVQEAYRLGYEDRSKERDYDPGHALDLLTRVVSAAPDFEFIAVPHAATRRWSVKWHDVTLSLTGEEYTALKVAAIDDPQEAMRLFETYRDRA